MPSQLDIVLPIRVRRVEKSAAPATTADGHSSHAAGFQSGYDAGKLRAEWEAGRQRDTERAQVRGLVSRLGNLHREYEKLLEEHMPELIQGALARVYRKHPFTADEIAAEVTLLLREMEQATTITLECAPAEADALGKKLEDCDILPSGLGFKLQGNPTLVSGEFVLKSDLGDVDGRHASRMRKIHLALEGAA